MTFEAFFGRFIIIRVLIEMGSICFFTSDYYNMSKISCFFLFLIIINDASFATSNKVFIMVLSGGLAIREIWSVYQVGAIRRRLVCNRFQRIQQVSNMMKLTQLQLLASPKNNMWVTCCRASLFTRWSSRVWKECRLCGRRRGKLN